MTSPASDSLTVILSRLDARVRRVDEERWLSSRYAPPEQRQALIVLYAFYYELARIRLSVSDQTLGRIRFQWWQDALTELKSGTVRQHDVVLAIADQVERDHLNLTRLVEIVAQFEAAFVSNDRTLEPEASLALAAAEVVSPGHDQSTLIQSVAPAWARARRSEAIGELDQVSRVPSPLRPALAHFRLRRSWARGKSVGNVGMRLSILIAVMTGSI